MIFGILGGDYRYKFLYEMLLKEDKIVKIYNNEYIKEDKKSKNFNLFLQDLDVLIAPIPFSKDNMNIFIPNFEDISIEKLFEKMEKNNIKLLAGGVFSDEIVKKSKEKNIKIFDFFKEESVAILNAIPTAEGAIQTAMEESNKTIYDSECLVLGYGRCGSILANTLKGLGANVTVSYRKKKDYAYIKAYGLNDINLYKIKEKIKNFDFIFNTIPHTILNEEILKEMDNSTIIVDLAQAPGGIDYNFARDLGLKALYCPGLPGRVAPFTAGKILKECILEYCDEINL